MDYYLHEVPGRLRIKIPALRRNTQLAREIQTVLGSFSGIRSTSVNTLTGSITVHYDPALVYPGAVLTFLSREEYIGATRVVSSRQPTDTALSKASRVAAKALVGLAMDRLLAGSPLSILTAFI